MKSSSWTRSQFTPNGVPLQEGERTLNRFIGLSLTVPRLRFGRVGTLVVTDRRLVFLVMRTNIALELPIIRITSMNSTLYPGSNQHAYYTLILDSGEKFSVQGLVKDIASLSTSLSSITVSNTNASTNQAPSVKKKIIRAPTRTPASGQASSMAGGSGIAGIQAGVQKEINQRDAALSAVHDIDDLKASASSLKEIARELSARTDATSGSEVNKIILALGLSDIANAQTDGAHVDAAKATAQQFAAAMEKLLPNYGGILSVAEAYVFFNRALGSRLISPTDMKYVIKEIETNPSAYKIRTEDISSGEKNSRGSKKNDHIKIILLESVSFEALKAEILKHCSENQYATPLAISKRTKLPTSIAKQYILRAESEGVLSRDDTLAGLRFYPNKFGSFSPLDF